MTISNGNLSLTSVPEKKKGRFAASLKITRPFIYLLTALIHIIILFSFSFKIAEQSERDDLSIFKIVDVTEYTVPEKEQIPRADREKEVLEVSRQDSIAENITETEKAVVESEGGINSIDFLPQHKISVPPGIPAELVKGRIEYPKLANMQKIEGVVFLELFIDSRGVIRNIIVLKDPGYGLAEAAVKAFEGVKCVPAAANGKPAAVRFRYPIRFTLK